MSIHYRAVEWNRVKIFYDGLIVLAVATYIAGYLILEARLVPPQDRPAESELYVRAFGSATFLMLTAILSIGPLSRLDRRFLPLLYNRRHFGVLTFFVATAHVAFAINWFLATDALPGLASDLTNWAGYGEFIGFPYEALGIAAFVILLIMAATSHDFWLSFLTPKVWKTLHLALYAAYGLVMMHVALGGLQLDRTLFLPLILVGGFGTVSVLHVLAARCERAHDAPTATGGDGWLVVGTPQSIPDKRARIVVARGGERIAVFRDGARVGALSNLCAHQNGPLGEGCIIDGYVTCPWHGYQYRLADGCAPPPFRDKLATYRLRLSGGSVEVDPSPLPPGTPATIEV
jgi:nitrite reductase/ring-hydroxylating ferredoxin subunit/DMSO/TMAO reductase YedYZ heme-binding membrane subunit